MTVPPPVVEGDLLERARAAVRAALQPDATAPLPADGLVRIFARLADIVAERIDRAPEKNLMAFLDLVGVRRTPARPARVPLSFRAAAGATAPVPVPAGTRVAAPPVPGDPAPVIFETERDLTLIAAPLTALWAYDPGHDRQADLTGLLAGGAGRDPFAGDAIPVRRLLIGCDAPLALGAGQNVKVTLGPNGGAWMDAVGWSWWDGASWQPLTATLAQGTATLPAVPRVPVTTLGGIPARWLAATLSTSLPYAVADPQLGLAARWSAPADTAWADSAELDPEATFAPFGVAGEAAAFGLRADDAFAKPGARVTLTFETAGATAPQLVWRYWTGAAWTNLAGVDDESAGLTVDGTVTFTVPSGWAPRDWPGGGPVARWLQVTRIGAYQSAPLVTGLTVAADWPVPRLRTIQIAAQAGGTGVPDAVVAGTAPVDPTADFLPLGAKPAPGATFAVAHDAALAPPAANVNAQVQLSVTLTTGAPVAPQSATAVLRWEYWDTAAAAWTALGDSSTTGGVANPTHGFTDTTKALTATGAIAFVPPATIGATSVAGHAHCWLRARMISGNYGSAATYVSNGQGGFAFQAATLAPPSIGTLKFAYSRTVTQPADVELLLGADGTLALPAPGADGAFEPFAPSGEPDPALYAGFAAQPPNAPVTLWLDAEANTAGDAAVAWEYWDGGAWSPLGARDETLGLRRAGVVTFIGPADIAPREAFGSLAWWVRARRPGKAAPSELRRALANTTWASEGTTVAAETLGSSTGEPGLQLALSRTPVLDGEQVDVREAERPPAGELPPDAPVEATTDGAWVRWAEVVDFLGSGPRDRHYTLDRQSGLLTFGDGRRGLVPPPARANVRATYRTGGGVRGNRAAGEIAQLKTALPGLEAASNPIAAAGGSDAEPLAAVRDRGPRGLRHRGRAVAPSDYEDIVREEVPAVARALAVPATGSQDAGTVGVVIIGAAPEPGPELLAAAAAAIQARAPATAGVWVSGPGWSEIAVSAGLAAVTPEAAGDVPAAAVEALDAFLDPLTGGPAGAGWPFGRTPHDSEIVALLERVPGVDHVAWLSLTRTDTEVPPSPGAFLVVPGRHAVTLVGS